MNTHPYEVRHPGGGTLACCADIETAARAVRDAGRLPVHCCWDSAYVANEGLEDCEGPMWDGEDVVTRYDNGLTEEEQELIDEASADAMKR